MSTAKYERSGYSFAIFLVWCTLRLPTNVGRTNYDELLNFQIVFNTFYAINGFRDAFSAVTLFLSFNGTGELYDAIGRFHFYFTGRDEIVRQQLGFDFTGRGRIMA